MSSKGNVTMRVRIGDNELEVTGSKTFVENKVQEFVEAQKATSPDRSRAPSQEATRAASHLLAGKKLSVAQLFKKVTPRSDVERTLVAGYYLEKYASQENFTTAELAQTIRASKNNPPKNPSDAVAKNIRKGLIMPSGDKDGKIAYVLTTDGEEAVESLLNE